MVKTRLSRFSQTLRMREKNCRKAKKIFATFLFVYLAAAARKSVLFLGSFMFRRFSPISAKSFSP
jgi:hypothetical protein